MKPRKPAVNARNRNRIPSTRSEETSPPRIMTTVTYNMNPGWNRIGFPFFFDFEASWFGEDQLGNILTSAEPDLCAGGGVGCEFDWFSAELTAQEFDIEIFDQLQINPAQGYWIHNPFSNNREFSIQKLLVSHASYQPTFNLVAGENFIAFTGPRRIQSIENAFCGYENSIDAVYGETHGQGGVFDLAYWTGEQWGGGIDFLRLGNAFSIILNEDISDFQWGIGNCNPPPRRIGRITRAVNR